MVDGGFGLAAFGALAKTSVLFMVAPSVVLLAGGLVARGQPRLGVGMVAIFGAGGGGVDDWRGAISSWDMAGAGRSRSLKPRRP